MKRTLFLFTALACLSLSLSATPVVFRDPLIKNQFTQMAFDPSNPFSVSVWARPNMINSRDYLNPVVSQHGNSAGWEIRLDSDGVIFLLTTNGVHQTVKVNLPVPVKQWMFIEARYTGEKIILQVNRQRQNAKSVAGPVTPFNGPIAIAQNPFWTDRRFDGQVRDLEIISYEKTYQMPLESVTVPKVDDINPGRGHHDGRVLVADFSNPQVTGDFEVTERQTDANPYYKGSHRLLNPNFSTITAVVSIKDPSDYSTLKLTHLSNMNDGKAGFSPITIRVNDAIIAKHHNPSGGGGNYFSEEFDVADYVKRGRNVITISLGDARTHYWIKKLELY